MRSKMTSLLVGSVMMGVLALPSQSCSPRTAKAIVHAAMMATAIAITAMKLLDEHDAHRHSVRCGHPRRFHQGRWIYYYKGRWEYYDPRKNVWYQYPVVKRR